jgi:hypothetical protein
MRTKTAARMMTGMYVDQGRECRKIGVGMREYRCGYNPDPSGQDRRAPSAIPLRGPYGVKKITGHFALVADINLMNCRLIFFLHWRDSIRKE